MPKLKMSDNCEISYRTIGKGPRNIILVHGWMVSSVVYEWFLESMKDEDVRILVPDLRGAGASDKPTSGYTIEHFATDILAVADHEKMDKFVLVGHSMGGMIAQWIAASHPKRVQGMVLPCPVPARGVTLPPDFVPLFTGAAKSNEARAAILKAVSMRMPDDRYKRMCADSNGVVEASVRDAYLAWTGTNFEAKLSQVKAPTLVVATDDASLPPAFLKEAIIQHIPKARLAHMAGVGHYVPVEAPAELAALVSAFLAGLH